MKSRPGRCCNQQSQELPAGSPSTMSWWSLSCSQWTWMAQQGLEATLDIQPSAFWPVPAQVWCACSPVVGLTPSSMSSALLIRTNAHHPLIHLVCLFQSCVACYINNTGAFQAQSMSPNRADETYWRSPTPWMQSLQQSSLYRCVSFKVFLCTFHLKINWYIWSVHESFKNVTRELH